LRHRWDRSLVLGTRSIRSGPLSRSGSGGWAAPTGKPSWRGGWFGRAGAPEQAC